MKIADIPENLRPREKALVYGIEELSDQELLALIIGSGVRGHSALEIAGELLNTHANSMESLSNTNYQSLLKYLGLKASIASRLLAVFEFHKRLNSNKYQNISKIESINDVYLRYKYLENFDQEILMVLMLDLKGRIIKEKMLYKGTTDSFSVNTKQLVRELILAKAKKFYLIHNHPDENDEPSEDDIVTTKAIEKAAKNMNVKLVDHIIIYKDGFTCIRR